MTKLDNAAQAFVNQIQYKEILSKEMNVLKSGNIGIPFSKIVLENKLHDKNEISILVLMEVYIHQFLVLKCLKILDGK